MKTRVKSRRNTSRKNTSRRNTYKSNSRSKLGGAAIAAGGYGCVFKPALKCKSATSRTNGVSKVLLTHYANDEMREISKVRAIVSKIPNYNDYFLGLDADICELDNFTADDKVNFDSKCGNLTKEGINSSNINVNLYKVRGINVPYGGLEFQKFFIKNKLNRENFVKVNKSMIKMLKNGLAPMNKLKLFHFDLKGPNILIGDDFNARIIDWGLSGIQIGNEIPNGVRTRPFMYNMPFSICLFAPEFKNFIKTNVKSTLTSLTISNPISLNKIRNEIKLIMIKWIYDFINNGGQGHYTYLPTVIDNLMMTSYNKFPLKERLNVDSIKKNNIITLSFLNHYIVDELTEAVIQYTNLDGVFNEERFFNDAFKHNADIWGLLTCYVDDLVRLLLDGHSNNLTKEQSIELLYGIKNIAFKYMFNGRQLVHPIDVDILERDLRQLNDIVGDIRTPSPSPVRMPTPPRIPTPVVAPIVPAVAAPVHHAPGPGKPKPKPKPKLVLVSSSRSKPSSPARVASKKKRVRHVTCDDAKKAYCLRIGKVCNEATGRCIKP
jgi:hypothetical protein